MSGQKKTRAGKSKGQSPSIPAMNTARFNYLISLARQLEENNRGWGRTAFKAQQLAAVYREMAFAAMPSAPDPEALELTSKERNVLADKLRRMTVANGCTEAEADTALQMLLRREGKAPDYVGSEFGLPP